MALTDTEKAKFATAKLNEFKRLTDDDLEAIFDPDIEGDSRTAKERKQDRKNQIDRLAKKTAPQLKARINVSGVSGGSANFSSNNNYTAQEQTDIGLILKGSASKWDSRIPDRLKQAKQMRTDGVAESAITSILTS